jgi:hypothetical protein
MRLPLQFHNKTGSRDGNNATILKQRHIYFEWECCSGDVLIPEQPYPIM